MKKLVLVLLVMMICLSNVIAGGRTDAGAAGKESLTVWQNAMEGLEFERYVGNFQKLYPEFNVEIINYPSEDLKTQQRLAVDSGTAPDVMYVNAGTLFSDFYKAGALGDITPIVNKLNLLSRINPDYIKPYTVNGRYYGFPGASLTTWMNLYVNRDLFAKAGITRDPRTLSELIDVCNRLKNAGIAPIAIGDKDGWPTIILMGDFFAQQVTNMAVINAVNTGRTKFTNSPELRKALDAVFTLGRAGAFISGFTSMNHTGGIQAFAAGQAAMLYNGSWWTGETGTTDLGFNLDVITLPFVDGITENKSVFMSSDVAYVVNPKSVNKVSVEKFLDYVTKEEACIYKAQDYAGFSIYPGSNAKIKINPLFMKAPVQNQFSKPSLAPFFDWVFPTPVTELLKVLIHQGVAGSITVDQALAQLQVEMDKNLNTMPLIVE